MSAARSLLELLSAAERERYEQIASAFDDAWQQHPERPPDLETFLPAPGPLRSAVLLELVRIDVELRLNHGAHVRPEEYLDCFPELRAQPEEVLALVEAEIQLRGGRESDRTIQQPEERLPEPAGAAGNALRGVPLDRTVLLPETGSEPAGPAAPPSGRGWPHVPGYEILGELGHGSMGVVYKARQRGVDRLVALKMIRAGSRAQPELLQRFLAEARVVASLQHPNIVQLHEINLEQDSPFFSMELIEGGSLAQRLLGRPQPFDESAQLVQTLARTVHVAHQNGIVHRDLKPGNILLHRKSEIRRGMALPSRPDGEAQARLRAGAQLAKGEPSHDGFRISDFEPKVTDFGLAKQRRDGTQTESGVILGTPNYMAPEQAEGKSHAVGPAADVYALGVILYELLTGRPPFRAESSTEMLLLLVQLEPVPPARLRARVPRDLETICLKCLHKEPARRYASAAELADDLERFLEGRPIVARPVSTPERLLRWCRRKPAAAALVASAVLLLGLAVAGGLWLQRQHAEAEQRQARARQGVEAALEQVAHLRGQGRWPEAGAVLAQAESRVEDANSVALREQLQQARADLKLAAALEDVRLKRAILVDGKFDLVGAAEAYAAVFAGAGLVGDQEQLASRLRASAIREQLVAALDDWAWVTPEAGERARLLRLARQVDPDPRWRDRFRDPVVWKDRQALERLAAEAPVAELSPSLLTVLGQLLVQAGADAAPLLREAQWGRPDDFWLNFELGNVLSRRDEAVGYYQAALVRRPASGAVYTNLGHALFFQERKEEGLRACRRAIELEPRYASAHYNLGQILRLQGRREEGLAALRRAVELDPRHAPAHTTIGVLLANQGRLDEAIAIYRHVMEFDPRYYGAPYNLGLALRRQYRPLEAQAALRRAIELNPNYARACKSLGEVLLEQGRCAEALRVTGQCFDLLRERDPDRDSVRRHLEKCQRFLALDGKLPAFLLGTEQAKDAEEQRDLGELCFSRRDTAAAVRFYSAAFEAQPQLARNLGTRDRYRAARAAALAGTGQGTDAATLDTAERSRLRRQALDFLRGVRGPGQATRRTAAERQAAGKPSAAGLAPEPRPGRGPRPGGAPPAARGGAQAVAETVG